MAVIHTTIAFVVAAAAAIGTQPRDLPRDFGIRMELGLCWRDVVDTRADRYTRDTGQGPEHRRSTQLRLTDAQWRDLSRWVEESRFFTLPAEIFASSLKVYPATPEVPEPTSRSSHPSPRYVIEIQSEGRRHRVEFDDDNTDASTESLTLIRGLVKQLEEFFTQLPQVKKLPPVMVGCI